MIESREYLSFRSPVNIENIKFNIFISIVPTSSNWSHRHLINMYITFFKKLGFKEINLFICLKEFSDNYYERFVGSKVLNHKDYLNDISEFFKLVLKKENIYLITQNEEFSTLVNLKEDVFFILQGVLRIDDRRLKTLENSKLIFAQSQSTNPKPECFDIWIKKSYPLIENSILQRGFSDYSGFVSEKLDNNISRSKKILLTSPFTGNKTIQTLDRDGAFREAIVNFLEKNSQYKWIISANDNFIDNYEDILVKKNRLRVLKLIKTGKIELAGKLDMKQFITLISTSDILLVPPNLNGGGGTINKAVTLGTLIVGPYGQNDGMQLVPNKFKYKDINDALMNLQLLSKQELGERANQLKYEFQTLNIFNSEIFELEVKAKLIEIGIRFKTKKRTIFDLFSFFGRRKIK